MAIGFFLSAAALPSAFAADVQQLLDQAEQDAHRGDHPAAMDSVLQAVQLLQGAKDPKLSQLLPRLLDSCQSLIEQNSYESAIRGLVAALPLAQSSKLRDRVRDMLEQVSWRLVLEERPYLAIPALEALVIEPSDSAMTWAWLARAYLDTGDFQKAEETIKQGLTRFEDSAELLFAQAALVGTLSEREVKQSRYSQAESLLLKAQAFLLQALGKEPNVAGIHRALGKISASLWVYYRATGQYQQSLTMLNTAEESYSNALHLEPANPEPAMELGELLFSAQDWLWAQECFQEAQLRYARLLGSREMPRVIRDAMRNKSRVCQLRLMAIQENRLLDQVNLGAFDHARELILQISRQWSIPRAEQKTRLRWLANLKRDWDQQVDRLNQDIQSGDSQVLLGDLWMRMHRYEDAQKAYQQALSKNLVRFTHQQVNQKIFGTLQLPLSSSQTSFQIGDLNVLMEVPEKEDLSLLPTVLQKAYAQSMAFFSYRLTGTFNLKVFPNRRSFMEYAGPRIGTQQLGAYVFGCMLTFIEPNRTQGEWLKVLVHEITHRTVDEISYSRAPRWFSEGLAQWMSDGFSPDDQARLIRLSSEQNLAAWDDLDFLWVEHWNDPTLMSHHRLQSLHIVQWLIQTFQSRGVVEVLKQLRSGQSFNSSLESIWGIPAAMLEAQWRNSVQNP